MSITTRMRLRQMGIPIGLLVLTVGAWIRLEPRATGRGLAEPRTDYVLEVSAISSGGAVLSDGTILVAGQATVGVSTDTAHTLHAGIVPCLLAGQMGDIDGDGDVDLADYTAFGECLFGPAAAPNPLPPPLAQECLAIFDVDADGDVDLQDFAAFQAAFSGN